MPAQAAALIAVVVLTWLPTSSGGFVWDDDVNVVRASALRTARGLWSIWAEPGAMPQYHPITQTTFWLEYQAWLLDPLPYHVTNIALHALSAMLLLILLRRLDVPGALLGALSWAVHPQQVESVALVAERTNSLSAALALGSLLAYERFLGAAGKGWWKSYVGSAVLFALALLAGWPVVGIPLIMAGLAWWKSAGRPSLRERAAQLTPFLLMSAAACVTMVWVETQRLQPFVGELSWSMLQRLFIATQALWFYPAKVLVPVGLMFIYPRWDVDPANAQPWAYVIATVSAVVALIVLRRKVPRGVVVAIASHALLLAPFLGLVNVHFLRFTFAQNQLQYHAGMATCALVGAGLWKLGQLVSERSINLRRALAATLVALIASASVIRSFPFANDEELCRTAMQDNPQAWVAGLRLGNRYLKERRSAAAIPLLEEVVRARPADLETSTNLGAAYAGQQRYDEALAVFEHVLSHRPASPEAHFNVAVVHDRLGHGVLAVHHMRRALELRADWIRAQRMLAWILATDPDDAARDGWEAVVLATEACGRTRKAVGRCFDTLAAAFAETGQFEHAVQASRLAEQSVLLTRDELLSEAFRERRALYESGKPFRRSMGELSDDSLIGGDHELRLEK